MGNQESNGKTATQQPVPNQDEDDEPDDWYEEVHFLPKKAIAKDI